MLHVWFPSRSALTCGEPNRMRGRNLLLAGDSAPDPFDLPFEHDTGILLHAPAHGLTQRLDIGCGRPTEIDQEIAVHRRDLRAADLKPAAAGGVDQLPSLLAGRILEGGAARAALDRLRCLA